MIKILNNLCAISTMDGKIFFLKIDKMKNDGKDYSKFHHEFSFTFNKTKDDVDENLQKIEREYKEY